MIAFIDPRRVKLRAFIIFRGNLRLPLEGRGKRIETRARRIDAVEESFWRMAAKKYVSRGFALEVPTVLVSFARIDGLLS
jgi:hypothetical protein